MQRILVVDDQFDITFLVKVVLTKEGYEVKTVASKTAFVAALEQFKPNLVILDVMLKGDNGRDICKEIKTAQYKHIPIILYSANPAMLENYAECYADDILEKPFTIAALIAIVNKHLKSA